MSNHSLRAQSTDLLFSHGAWFQLRMSRILFAAKTDLDGIMHEQTIICRQLFAGHVVGSQPMKIGEKIHRMIT